MTGGIEEECSTIKPHIVADGMCGRVKTDESDNEGWHVGAGRSEHLAVLKAGVRPTGR